MRNLSLTKGESEAIKKVLFIWSSSIQRAEENNALNNMPRKAIIELGKDLEHILSILKKLK